jgi:hypothetical protein
LNERAQRVAERWLDGLRGTPLSTRIIVDDQNNAHVFSIVQLDNTTLRLAHWMPGNERKVWPISPEGINAESYAVVARQAGTFEAFWVAEPGSNAQGLYYARFNAEGQILAERQINAQPAEYVSAQVDGNGAAHVVWAEMLYGKVWQVAYAEFPAGEPQPTEGRTMTQTDAYPAVGLDNERVYILWGQEIKGGMFAGMGYTSFLSFPFGKPEAAREQLSLPASGEPDYQPYQGPYKLQTIGDATAKWHGDTTNFVHSPAPVMGQHEQLAAVVISGLAFGYNERIIPALVLMQGGQVIGYQAIALPDGYNMRPILAASPSGALHAAWLTGSAEGGYRVYYTAATAAARAALDGYDLTDYLVGITTLVWQMLGGFALLPFFPMIIVPGLVIAIVYSMMGSETLYERDARIALIVACLAYWLFKEFILGSVLTELELGRELTGWARTALIWAVQVAIAAIAGLVTWRQVANERTDSIFWAMMIFVACDMTLTMLVAGPTLALRG